MRVSTSDVRRIIRFLDVVPIGTPAEMFPPRTLSALTGVIGADQADYFEVRRDRRFSAFTKAFVEGDMAWVDALLPRIAPQNPLGAFKWNAADGPLRMSAVISPSELRRLDYHREFLEPAGIRDRLRVWLRSTPDAAACLTLTRFDGDFSDQDVALLAVLQPHLRWLRQAAVAGTDEGQPPVSGLTVREAQVLTLAAAGQANKEIGQLLSTSPETVRKHLERAYRKLNVDSRSEAAAWLRSGRSD